MITNQAKHHSAEGLAYPVMAHGVWAGGFREIPFLVSVFCAVIDCGKECYR